MSIPTANPRSPVATLLFLVAIGTGGCGWPSAGDSTPAPAATRAWFEDATAASGLTFVHDAGVTGQYWMPQAIGSGAALFDFDNDGWLDIYLLQNGGRTPTSVNRLFRNTTGGRPANPPASSLQPPACSFTDVTAVSGLGVAGQGMGVAAGDANNDGWVDLVVTEYGKLRFFTNQGDGTFRETATESGLVSPLWGCSAAFVDYDRDGWLDLVVVNYVAYDPSRPCINAGGIQDFCAPKEFEGTVTKLFRNLGARTSETQASSRKPQVSFSDVTLAAGLGQTPGPGLGVLCADFNADRWPDIFVANDGKPNRLWINQHDGTFRDEAVIRGVAYNSQGAAEANMGVALADVDGQHGPDLFVTHLTEERHTLWRQAAPGSFADRTAASRIAKSGSRGTGFGTVLADFDHDGDVDLAIVNGRISKKQGDGSPKDAHVTKKTPDAFWLPYAERNQLFGNDGNGVFEDISARNEPFSGTLGVSRGLACGDLDNDGDLDLVVTAIGEKARLFLNIASSNGNWLVVRAIDTQHRRDAYGAEITVHAGSRNWWRQIHSAYSYLCSNDPRAHFGLGDITTIDRIEVAWPDGTKEVFPGGAANRLVELRKGEGKADSR
jgi:hypothetical protein